MKLKSAESPNVTAAMKFEHRFWLQILGDHARFIHQTLAPEEKTLVSQAKSFIETFDRLLADARADHSLEAWVGLTQEISKHAETFRKYKLELLSRHLQGNIKIQLPPTFINHMVNELDEYRRILQYLAKGEVPPLLHPLHHHLIWLDDAAGHAAGVASELDQVEKRLMKKSQKYEKYFLDFYYKAVQMAGYLRTGLKEFPALGRFNKEVEWELVCFKKFLEEIEELRLSAKVLGTLSPLMADHMAREECYYLTQLSRVTEISQPDCDPAKPRTQE